MKTWLRVLLVLTALTINARALDLITNFVDFQVQINGHPARMILVTSIGASLVVEEGAKRLDLKGDPFSDLTEVQSGGKKFNAPILVFRDPLLKLPWFLRALIKVSHPFLYHEFKNIYDQVTKSMEGVIGWPDIRDNILVFDSERHIIRRVEQLPPETADWIKLRVLPTDTLMLEVPLDGGKKGVVWIDTADSRSMIMAPPQWKQWTQAHPAAQMLSRKVVSLPAFVDSEHETLADEVKLGPLTVKDAAIEDMSADDASRLREDTPAMTTSWVLGVGALERIDLIVDGKNGWAYLHAKPPQTAPPPLMTRKEAKRRKALGLGAHEIWTVETNVQLGADCFFVREGEFKWSKEDFKAARSDFTRALEFNPRNADCFSDLGALDEYEGDFIGAVSNYNKVIELKPDYSEWERLYRQTLLWRTDETPKEEAKPSATAKADSSPATGLNPVEVVGVQPQGVPGCDYGWTKTLGQYLVGRMDDAGLLAAAKKSGDPVENKALAYYYIGASHLSRGDKSGARNWFQKCKDARQKGDNEYYFAVSELKRLDRSQPPAK